MIMLKELLVGVVCMVCAVSAAQDEYLPKTEDNPFGCVQNAGEGLKGTFYDLKTDRKDKLTGIGKNEVLALLAGFVTGGVQEARLSKYYRSPEKLYASSFYLPQVDGRIAPIAFGVGEPEKPVKSWQCQPGSWLAIYRGYVIAPKTGKFRFIGGGDDVIAVRFNNRLVLEAGYYMPGLYSSRNPEDAFVAGHPHGREYARLQELMQKKHWDYERMQMGIGSPGSEHVGLIGGSEFEVKAGQRYPVQIMIADVGGNKCGFALLVEDVTKGRNRRAVEYDLFRTSEALPDTQKLEQLLRRNGAVYGGLHHVNFKKDSLIWKVAPPRSK